MTHFLAACRYPLIIPVIGCIILTAGTVMMGIVRIVTAGAKLVRAGRTAELWRGHRSGDRGAGFFHKLWGWQGKGLG
jgi:hypothetical protein